MNNANSFISRKKGLLCWVLLTALAPMVGAGGITHLEFLSETNPGLDNEITLLECYWDKDPGEGRGIRIPVQEDGCIMIELTTANLNEGLHRLHIRAKANGLWSEVASTPFYCTYPYLSEKVEVLECYWDKDPGEEMGTPVTMQENGSIIHELTTANLNEGLHRLHIRAKANGLWSEVASTPFYCTYPYFSEKIDLLECYWDKDPGEGMGTPITVQEEGSIIQELTTANLDEGLHRLHIRAKANGLWSEISSTPFYCTYFGNLPEKLHLNGIEYFWDTDPGIGEAQPIAFIVEEEGTALLEEVTLSTSELVVGTHQLGLRAFSDTWISTILYSVEIVPYDGIQVPQESSISLSMSHVDGKLSVSGLNEGDYLLIYGADGKQHLSLQAESEAALVDASLLSKGMYILVVRSKAESQTLKFIKK